MTRRQLLMILSLQICSAWSFSPHRDATCQFPKYVVEKPKWESKIRNERLTTGKFVKFSETSVVVFEFTSNSRVEKVYEIAQCVGQNKYLLRQHNENKHQCMQIVERSNFIFQWKLSQFTNFYGNFYDLNICSDENLLLDPWVFVYIDKGVYELPSIVGGFNLEIYDHKHGKRLCDDYWLPPSFESECTGGEGLKLDFRLNDCIGDLNMNIMEGLHWLGSWVDGVFEYSVITNGDELWPKLWMVRTDAHHDDNKFDLFIFKHLKCEKESTEKISDNEFYVWSLTKKSNLWQCRDHAPPEICRTNSEQCSEFQKIYCKKSCQQCQERTNHDEESTCEFLENVEGNWNLYVPGNNIENVTIERNVVHFGNTFPPFRCFHAREKDWLRVVKRKPLIGSMVNGCRPRYVCFEVESKNENVLGFRLSDVTIFQSDEQVSTDVICNDNKFLANKPYSKLFYRHKKQQFLIRNKQDREQENPNCGIQDSLFLRSDIDRMNYYALMNTNNVIVNNTCHLWNATLDISQILLPEWKCLSKFTIHDDNFLIVEGGNDFQDSTNVQCWITHQNKWSTEVLHFYVVHPWDCNELIPQFIEFGNYHGYIAAFKVVQVKNLPNLQCESLEKNFQATNSPVVSKYPSVPAEANQSSDVKNRFVTQNIPPSENTSDTYSLEKATKKASLGLFWMKSSADSTKSNVTFLTVFFIFAKMLL